ncbi:uncharacterized protein BDW47DRAFT_130190 [Aspergillus candidus]|uniref:Fe2OG dioxygenase domain-containing protein n=1 Tax=Aspergillus candidus TaxID=41067 RepID=A0A2I2EXN7_ASPCN|nr:hypothetical protein BDW47DRAFT_130190 [Aspergillus candidus]PLB33147.1 hypothetical protein BDW47DRAFT_130190 [Aspergillus candidus]
MNFGEFQNGKAQQPLPQSLATHEAEIAHFADLCTRTCNRILKLLALGLEIPPDFFTTRHDPHQGPTGSILRYLYYPSISSPSTATYKHDVDVRAGAHSDYGSITLLFQRPGQPGLEILPPAGTDNNNASSSNSSDNNSTNWAPVPVQPNQQPGAAEEESKEGEYAFPPILVNIGDLLSYWTDGLLKSTVHRVVFPLLEQRAPSPQDRYSIVFFCHPRDTTELVPVPSEVVAAYRRQRQMVQGGEGDERVGFGGGAGALQPGKRALTAYEHLMSRLAATYGERKEA